LNAGGRKKICFRFQKGECTFGDSCMYRHDLINSSSGGSGGGGGDSNGVDNSAPAEHGNAW